MDFFNSQTTSTSSSRLSDGQETPFGRAINERFALNANSSLLTARPTPAMTLQTPMVPSTQFSLQRPSALPKLPPLTQGVVSGASAVASSSIRHSQNADPSATSMFKELNPAQIVSLLKAPTTLFIDIRPATQAEVSHMSAAVSLIVPTTLLKRPMFGFDKMAEMVDPVSRPKFETWASASKIIIFDADTAILSEGSNILALLRKFHTAGYKGELCWIKGGFNAIAQALPSIIDSTQPAASRQDAPNQPTGTNTLLRARHISTHAFQQSSTSLAGQSDPRTGILTQPSTGSSMAANPFYDNIRQNLELSQGVDPKIPLVLPPEIIARKNQLPAKWLRDLVDQAEADTSEDALSMQFYRIELGEQRRLQRVMEHHSRESGANAPFPPPDAVDFPYSITAGIEMGSKNRYRNVWPFEHARVRLSQPAGGGGSDYVNASYVQSLVSSRRYIATQGPMDSTYDDFWSICWDQKVPIIVMLTREVESSLVKCGKYWKDGTYGDIVLRLVNQDGKDDVPKPNSIGGFFRDPKKTEQVRDTIIERVFQLRSRSRPDVPPRKIVHLQYLGWPDQDVPSSPTGLLTVIKRVNTIMEIPSDTRKGPVLLHCSAGVGRTGGFILVDSILAGVRHEMLKTRGLLGRDLHFSSSDMDLDVSDVPTEWSRSAVEGTSANNETSSRHVFPKLKPLSNIVADNQTRTFTSLHKQAVSSSNVAEWTKDLPEPISQGNGTPQSIGSPAVSDGGRLPDYKLPRPHRRQSESPPLPSSLNEPIREVRAIIEGALELVDELNNKHRHSYSSDSGSRPGAVPLTGTRNEMAWSSTSSISSTSDLPPPSSPSHGSTGRLSFGEYRSPRMLSSSPPQPRPLTGKRTGSPIDLHLGDSGVNKRSSLKRKHQRSESQSDETPRGSSSSKQQHLESGPRGRA
ncbi:hypothetical protein CPB86DRAFT_782253 [Serendipita vermifera]|nr:hypothetical protein CPB86DRAFT_782253 [Serendipita vermifera]